MKYTVLSNFKHDGQLLTQGDQIDLPKDIGAPLEKDGILSSAKVPVIKQKDWKKGPDDIIPGPDAEIDSTGNAPEKEEGEVEDAGDETAEESKIAGAQDDTSKIDENIDENL